MPNLQDSRPERISVASREHREFRDVESHFAPRPNQILNKFRLADQEERPPVFQDIQNYNQEAVQYAAPPISSKRNPGGALSRAD